MAELEPLAAAEGMAAARQMYRGHNFPTVANFGAELAQLRERRADEHGPNFNRPALKSLERITPAGEAKAHLTQLRSQLLAMSGPLARSLANALPGPGPGRPRPRRPPNVKAPRADESYFHPPEPDPNGRQSDGPEEVA
jgi:hypothetical protein